MMSDFEHVNLDLPFWCHYSGAKCRRGTENCKKQHVTSDIAQCSTIITYYFNNKYIVLIVESKVCKSCCQS